MTEDPNNPSQPGDNTGDNKWDPVPPAGQGPQTPPPSDAPSWASAPPPPVEGSDAQPGLIACLVLGIVETLCCCPGTPFGIAAIIFSAIGLSKNGKGDYVAARKNRKIAIWLLAIGFVLFIAFFIYWQASGAESWLNYFEDVTRDLEQKSTTTLP